MVSKSSLLTTTRDFVYLIEEWKAYMLRIHLTEFEFIVFFNNEPGTGNVEILKGQDVRI